MSSCHRFVQLMREAGKTPQNEIVDIVMGEVTSVKPLRVRIENRELTESFLILGALCKEAHSTGTPSTMLWRGLVVGDRVLMLKVGRGQKYFIMQREGGI